MGMRHSAIYHGSVRHRRHGPVPHQFHYRMSMVYFDLDELTAVCALSRLWSVERSNWISFRRSDYLGEPSIPLKQAVLDRVESTTSQRPNGRVTLLTQPRCLGLSFNPVSFYYCFDADDALHSIVAEITNTPWGERHSYVLRCDSAKSQQNSHEWQFAKQFHVSPFLPMNRSYRWRISEPGQNLRTYMAVKDGRNVDFDASLTLQREPISKSSMRSLLWRQPAMSLQTLARIYLQAARLWRKKTPFHPHPRKAEPGKPQQS